MAKPAKAYLVPRWMDGDGERIDVDYNPKEFTIDKATHFAEITIPGLGTPLQQFVRGQAAQLSVELFCDTTDKGMGRNAESVTRKTDRIFQLAKIEPKRHAPPQVTFHWNAEFPGAHFDEELGNHQRESSFTGIVESVKQRFTLFNPDGVPLRAVVTLVLREYKTLHQQVLEDDKTSPDRTHSTRVLQNQRIDGLAYAFYRDAGAWREIARANTLEDPRRLDAGRELRIPPLDQDERRVRR